MRSNENKIRVLVDFILTFLHFFSDLTFSWAEIIKKKIIGILGEAMSS